MDAGLTRGIALAAALVSAGWFAAAQTIDPGASPDAAPPVSPGLPPPPPEIGPAVEAPPQIVAPRSAPQSSARSAVAVAPPPPAVLRSPVAVLQVLDKVTAETLRFEAPVGRRVRYKTLVVQAKACETRSYAEAQPRSSVYLTIDTQAPSSNGPRTREDREVFHGWMFAFAPALHALQHPVYDIWLIACSASAPVA